MKDKQLRKDLVEAGILSDGDWGDECLVYSRGDVAELDHIRALRNRLDALMDHLGLEFRTPDRPMVRKAQKAAIGKDEAE